MLARVRVEHELHERALEPGTLTQQECEPRARDPRRPLEVHDAERLTEVVVGARREAEVRFGPPLPLDHVVGLRLADRHGLVEKVGDAQEQVIEPALERFGIGELGLGSIGHLAQPRLESLVPRLRKLLRQPVLLGLDLLGRVKMRAPLAVQLEDLVHRRGLPLELGGAPDAVRVATDQLQRQHATA